MITLDKKIGTQQSGKGRAFIYVPQNAIAHRLKTLQIMTAFVKK